MSLRDPKRISDGFRGLDGGMDGSRDPSIIDENQCAFMVNATVRDGYIHNRPGIWRRALSFTDQSGAQDPALRSSWEGGYWQGARRYRPAFGSEFIVASVSGRLFKITLDTWITQEIVIPGGPNPANRPRVWMEQAEDFLVIQDAQSSPIIFDGGGARRTMDSGEIPTGSVMAYGWGRLWIASPNGYFFVAGDLVYGSSGTDTYDFRDAVIKFTENKFLNGGGSFAVPLTSGPITSMVFTAQLDDSTGQGPLQVFTTTHGFSVKSFVDRIIWQDTTFPIETVNLINFGPVNDNSTVTINSDLWFRSQDGIRSFIVAQRQFAAQWINTPSSKEVNPIIEGDSQNLLSYASATLFDKRLLTTVSPTATTSGVSHAGLVVLDFDPLSSMKSKSPAAWEGVWTGMNILQVLTCDSRCFIFALDSDSKIILYEVSKSELFDHPTDGEDKLIPWSFDSKSFKFTDTGQFLKELSYGDLWIDRVSGTVAFNIQYRPDQYPGWKDWHSFSVCGNYKTCNLATCAVPENVQNQYRPRIKLPLPPEECEESTGKPFRQGYEFQTRLNVTGACRIRLFRINTHDVQENPTAECPTEEACTSESVCNLGPFGYLIG